METDTIAAIATALGQGGIGIVKISGPGACDILAKIFKPNRINPTSPLDIESHRLYYGYIFDPQGGRKLDEVLVSAMFAPHSYTRENVVEINTHGGYVILDEILSLVMRMGARPAQPGEFTRRAFLNGRIDLTRAEAVIDIINAKSRKALKYAVNQIGGRLQDKVESIKAALLDLLVKIEADIDFSEEIEEEILPDNIGVFVRENANKPIADLIKQYKNNKIYRDGIRLLIIGKPNVGKSSLLNRLINKDRAIVAATPGTTRDFIEETFAINGIPITLVDTAGLRHAQDEIEVQGIRKTHQKMKNADLLLLMTDASQPLDGDDWDIINNIKDHKTIVVLNKKDLLEKSQQEVSLPEAWEKYPCVLISALKDENINLLKEELLAAVREAEQGYIEDSVLPNLRQKELLQKAHRHGKRLCRGVEKGIGSELLAIDIKAMLAYLDEILGKTIQEELLDQIFNRFCIGK